MPSEGPKGRDLKGRKEHLKWCKEWAFQYLDKGDIKNAYTSFTSDMGKNSETSEHPALMLGNMLLVGGHLSTVAQMRKFIEDFN